MTGWRVVYPQTALHNQGRGSFERPHLLIEPLTLGTFPFYNSHIKSSRLRLDKGCMYIFEGWEGLTLSS